MIKVQLFNNYAQLLIWMWPVLMANRRHVNCSWKLKTCPCGLIWLSHGKLVIEKWIVVYSSFYMVINVVFVWGLSICCCNAASFFFFFSLFFSAHLLLLYWLIDNKIVMHILLLAFYQCSLWQTIWYVIYIWP